MGTFTFAGQTAANTLTIDFTGILAWPVEVATDTRFILDAGDRFLRLEGEGFIYRTLDELRYAWDGIVTRIAWTETLTGAAVSWNMTQMRLPMDVMAQVLVAGHQGAVRAFVFTHEDLLIGTAGPDVLASFKSNDTLTGREGNDTLRGGRDADKLFGGFGADDVRGEEGADTLVGGRGNDRLSGGPGYDTFLFSIDPDVAGRDTITDFSFRLDQVAFDNAAFTGLGPDGPLARDAFCIGLAARNSNHRIIHDRASGVLAYDPDGVGGVDAVQIAKFSRSLILSYRDFDII